MKISDLGTKDIVYRRRGIPIGQNTNLATFGQQMLPKNFFIKIVKFDFKHPIKRLF